MRKLFLLIPLLLFVGGSTIAQGSTNTQLVDQFDMNQERGVIVKVLGFMIDRAERQLKRKGRKGRIAANDLRIEWDEVYRPWALGLIDNPEALGDSPDALGDWPPLSDWLAEKYDQLEALIGPEAMAFTHLDDIKVINYAVPVVFDPCNELWSNYEEMSLHFIPLTGTLSYWLAWAACTGGTWGLGIGIICTPVGMASEHIMITYIAPDWSDRFLDRRCGI